MDLAELGVIFVSQGADAAIEAMDAFTEASDRAEKTERRRLQAAVNFARTEEKRTEALNAQAEGLATMAEASAKNEAAQERLSEKIGRTMVSLSGSKAEMLAFEAAMIGASERFELQILQLATLEKQLEENKNKVKALAQAEREEQGYWLDVARDIQRANKERQQAADAAVAAAKRTADAEIKEAERAAISQIQWAQKSRDEQIRIKEQIAAYKGAGVGDETLSKMFGSGALNGTVKEVESLAHHWDNVTFNTSRARSEMIVLAHEAVQGRFSRIPASMMVFAEYTDIAALAMTGAGLAVMGTVAVLATFAIAAAKGTLEWDSFNKTLAITGDYTAMTVSDFYTMADSMTAVHGKVGEAKEIIGELAATGKFTKTEIETIAPAILEMSEVGGVAVKTLVGEYAKLAEDPVNASKELNKHYHYLTVEIYSQIKALEEQGDKQGAAALAEKTLAEEQSKRMEKLRGELGVISRAWLSIQEGASRAWAAMKDIGKPEDDISKLAKLQAERAKLMTGRNDSWDTDEQYKAKLDQNNRDIIKLQNKMDNDRLEAEHKGAMARMEQAAIDAKDREDKDYDRSRSNAEKRDVEMARMYQDSATRNALSMMKSSKITEEARLRIEQAMNVPLPNMRDNTVAYMAESENRSKALLQIAQQYGLDIAVTTDRQNERVFMIENHWADKRKAAQKENSTTMLNEYVREANMAATEANKRADALVVITQRGYESQKQIEDDEFAILRSNAKARGQTGFLEAEAYADHIRRMRELNSNMLQDELAYYADARAAREQQTANIIEAENAQVTVTEEGRKRKEASIAKAYATLREYNSHMDDLEQKARERAQMNVAKVEADSYKMLNADMNSVINTLEKKLENDKAHLQTLQLSKEAIALLAAKEEERITTLLEGEQEILEAKKEAANGDTKLVRIYQEQIDKIKKIVELRKQLKDTENATATAQREFDRIKAVEEAWKHSWDQTNKTAQDVFVTWIEGGEDMAKKIGNMLKKSILEAIYNEKLKPLVLEVFMTFMGTGGSAGQKVLDSMGLTGNGTGAIGALNGAGSIFSGGSKAIDTVRGWLGLGGATGGSATKAALYGELGYTGAATASGSGVMGSMSSMLSSIPVAGWIAMGMMASSQAYDQGFRSDTSGKGLNALNPNHMLNATDRVLQALGIDGKTAAILSGSALGAAAQHFVFGGSTVTGLGGGIQGGLSGTGSSLSAYNVYSQDHRGFLGMGSYTTENREYSAASADIRNFVDSQIKTITDSAKKYGEALGVPVEKIDGFTKQIDVNLTNLDAAGVQKALQDAINGFADDLTNSAFGDAMAQFAKAGESTGTTLMRVTAEVGTVNATLAKLGGQLFNLDAAGMKAADGLVQAMGGLEAFQQQTASYYQNYYTQEEQRQMQAQDIAAKLAASGITVSVEQVLSGTREQFRALVESFTKDGGLMTESGQKAVAALMSVANAFASITVAANTATTPGSTGTTGTTPTDRWDWWNDPIKAAEHDRAAAGGGGGGVSNTVNKALQERTQLQQELDNLTLTSAELLKKQRDALDESNRALFDQVQAAKAAKAAADERKGLQDQYNQLTLTELQLRALERDSIALSNRDLYDRITAIKSAQKELDAAKTGVSNAMSSLQRAVDAEKQSIEAARQAAQERANILGSIVSTLGDAVGGIRGNVESTKAAAAARGNAFITDALATAKVSGYMPDADALKKAIGDARAGLDVNNYTSQFEYEKAQLELAGKLDNLKEIADPQLTAAKQAVKVAEGQLKALDAQLKLAQDQIDALNGIDTSVKSVAEAMTALTAAINAQKAAQDHLTGLTGGGGGGTTATTSWTGEKTGTLTNDFWKMWAGHMQNVYGENAGYKVYDMAKSQGITLADLDKAMGWTDGHAKAWALAHGLPAFAVGTNYVPSDMVAQIHEGEAIVPKAYNPAAGGASGNARLESLVEALTAEVQRLQAIVNDGNTHAQRTANAVNGNPEVPMLVTTV